MRSRFLDANQSIRERPWSLKELLSLFFLTCLGLIEASLCFPMSIVTVSNCLSFLSPAGNVQKSYQEFSPSAVLPVFLHHGCHSTLEACICGSNSHLII